MIEFEKEVELDLPPEANYSGLLDDMTLEELLVLRSEIDMRIPAQTLPDLNLEAELVRQYQQVKAVLGQVSNDPGALPGHKAQLSNSVQHTLAQLVKLQNDLYSSERFKAIEMLLIKQIKEWSKENTEEFLNAYEELYARTYGKT